MVQDRVTVLQDEARSYQQDVKDLITGVETRLLRRQDKMFNMMQAVYEKTFSGDNDDDTQKTPTRKSNRSRNPVSTIMSSSSSLNISLISYIHSLKSNLTLCLNLLLLIMIYHMELPYPHTHMRTLFAENKLVRNRETLWQHDSGIYNMCTTFIIFISHFLLAICGVLILHHNSITHILNVLLCL